MRVTAPVTNMCPCLARSGWAAAGSWAGTGAGAGSRRAAAGPAARPASTRSTRSSAVQIGSSLSVDTDRGVVDSL